MRTIFFILAVFTIGFVGCESTEPDDSQQQQKQKQEQTQEISSRGVTQNAESLESTLKVIINAFKNQDGDILNNYINEDKGVYYIQSTQGAYSECTHYNNATNILNDIENVSEYDINPLKYLLDYFNNVNTNEVEILNEDLFGVDACGFEKDGFFIDKNQADVKLLTDIYTMNIARDGDEIAPEELVKLGETQNELSKSVFIGDGEVTYTFYFTEEDGQWWLTIMDLRDCDT